LSFRRIASPGDPAAELAYEVLASEFAARGEMETREVIATRLKRTADGVVHYCVANIPGCVARTSTFALTNATFPFVLALASLGWRAALERDAHLCNGLNVCHGAITHRAVADSQGETWLPADRALTA
jgi:alanine dehydrogenase